MILYLFIGFAGSKTVQEVLSLEREILYHAENAALCHDIGKLFVIEIIMTYGRRLNDPEFDLIRSHTDIGAYVLRQHRDTESYSAVAQCHHDYYDVLDQRFENGSIPEAERPFIDITDRVALSIADETAGKSAPRASMRLASLT